jgi:hypothetical protein
MKVNTAKWYLFRNRGNPTQTHIACTKTKCKTKCADKMSRDCVSCVWARVRLLDENGKFIRDVKAPNPPQTYSEYMESRHNKLRNR